MPYTGHIPQSGDILGGKYEVESILGQGGMGVVLAARNLRTNRRVAIKWLLPWLVHNEVALKRFEREAQVAGGIVHPNVVCVYDVERDGETTYIVMELLEGRSLASYLADRPALALDEVMTIFMPILRGVAAAHEAGVVHRDLKPDNVFLCRQADGSPDVPKVLDFGISKITEREAGQTTLTQDGAVIGTIQYMSPEQLRGKPTDRRTDVYALGVILYRMLAGQPPFQGENHIDLALNIAGNRPPPLSSRVAGLPLELDAVLDRALSRDADQRIPDIESFARALQPFCGGAQAFRPGRSVPPAHPLAPPPHARSFEATPFALDDRGVSTLETRSSARWPAIAAVLALTAVGLWLWAPWSDGPPDAAKPTQAAPGPQAPAEPAVPTPQQAQAGAETPAAAAAPAAAPSTEGWVLTTESEPAAAPQPAAPPAVAAPRAEPAARERPARRRVERAARERSVPAADKPPAPDPPAAPSFDELLPDRPAPRLAPRPSEADEAWKNL